MLKMRDNEGRLTPGDLIEFSREGYQHWGIYDGKFPYDS